MTAISPFWTHRPPHGEGIATPVFVGIEVAQLKLLCGHETSQCGEYRIAFSCYDGASTVADLVDTVQKMQSDYRLFLKQHARDPDFREKLFRDDDQLDNFIIGWLKSFSLAHYFKIAAVGLVCPNKSPTEKLNTFAHLLGAKIWHGLDAVPFLMEDDAPSMEERVSAIARKVQQQFALSGPPLPRLSNQMLEHFNEVDVDFQGALAICTLSSYEFVSERVEANCPVFTALTKLAEEFKRNNLRITFLSSTPQGGGVAIMRHCLLRLLRMLNVDAHWCVPRPKPSVFQITKRKFHNVLQGVLRASKSLEEACHVVQSLNSRGCCDSGLALASINEPASQEVDYSEFELTAEDKACWEDWCLQNYQDFWQELIRDSHMVVVDDPQLCALIPVIKRDNPKCFVAYRSHIQIDSQLINQGSNLHHRTFSYLWDNFLRFADVFIAHPFDSAVPDMVPKDRVGFMPATTDALDGLNKVLNEYDKQYYFRTFARLTEDQSGLPMHCKHTKYIIQVARFDPSKGIPDVIEAFRILCERLGLPPACNANASTATDNHSRAECECACANISADLLAKLPRLVLCGHGAIDDPEGTVVFEFILHLLRTSKYHHIGRLVAVTRLPPCDQLLNTLLSNAAIALQLSHREGFEIKVTEAMLKGIPVIAYRAGGLALQITHGETGFLVEIGDVHRVAEYMSQLLTDHELYGRISKQAKDAANKALACSPIGEAGNWLCLALKALKQREMASEGGAQQVQYDLKLASRPVMDLWRQESLPAAEQT